MNKGILIDGERTYTERKRLLFVDSRDCVSSGDSRFEYTVNIGSDQTGSVATDPYNNVSKIELKAISFPKIDGEDYVIMTISEISDYLDSTSNDAHRSSCVVFFDNAQLATGEKKTVYPLAGNGREFVLNPIIPKLSKLHVKFSKRKGSSDGAAIGSTTANIKDHSFLLEITELV